MIEKYKQYEDKIGKCYKSVDDEWLLRITAEDVVNETVSVVSIRKADTKGRKAYFAHIPYKDVDWFLEHYIPCELDEYLKYLDSAIFHMTERNKPMKVLTHEQ